jgi:DNA invertase Pin-like site-specific DNA recombinase
VELKSKEIYKMKKVCFYCRVNSSEQAEGTAERMAKQIERCRNVADLHNFTVVDEMRDFCGHSMEEVNRRRALNEMIAKARRGEFNSVVIPSLKVLSLDVDVGHVVYEKIKETGVEVISANEGEVKNEVQKV